MTQSPPPDNWFRHALDQTPWRDQQQAGSLALAVVVIVAVIGAIYLAQASTTAAAGRRLQAMEARRRALEQQNAQLRAEIAALQSVPRLTSAAESMGFRPATSDEVEFVRLDGVALPAEVDNSPALPEPDQGDEVEVYTETLESWLTEQLTFFRDGVQQFFTNTFGREEEAP